MELTFVLLADYANISREGKLNVLGIFNRITAGSFPARHPQMQLVTRLTASPAEYGTKRMLTIKLLAEDGEEMVNIPRELEVPRGEGRKVELNHILVLNDVLFHEPGEYCFSVLVDNDEKGAVPLVVTQATGSAGD